MFYAVFYTKSAWKTLIGVFIFSSITINSVLGIYFKRLGYLLCKINDWRNKLPGFLLKFSE